MLLRPIHVYGSLAHRFKCAYFMRPPAGYTQITLQFDLSRASVRRSGRRRLLRYGAAMFAWQRSRS